MKIKISENEVVKSCLHYLSLMGFFCWRQNTTGIYRAKSNSYSFNGMRGVADILALKHGTMYAIECKSPGKKSNQSPEQKLFEQNVIKNGCIYILCDSVNDLESQLKIIESKYDCLPPYGKGER